MAETAYVIPVYRGWPERPYEVLGSVRFVDPNVNWLQDEGIISAAAHEAKKHGADAIILRSGAELGVFGIAESSDKPMIGYSYQTTALAIRWLTAKEIAERQKTIDDFMTRLGIFSSGNYTVAELALKYLVRTGLEPSSPDLFNRFEEIIKRLVAKNPENLNGEWVFKTTISLSSDIDGGDNKTEIGVARVSTNGETINIVSTEGSDEINFTGVLAKGGLSGQVGVGQRSSKASGVAMNDKISVNFQSATRDGLLHGNLILQRLVVNLNPTNDEKNNTSISAGHL
jgi:hypothetical protein